MLNMLTMDILQRIISFKHATIISNILERYGKEKLQEIEKNCQSTISARGINFRVYAANNRAEKKNGHWI